MRTLEGLLDVRMDHVAQVDLDRFAGLTTELGGVRVYNEHATASKGYSFPVGRITVSGEQAEAYVRERKQLPRGDLDRTERHRAVLSAILTKGLSGDTVASPRRFLRFTSQVARHVTVDEELTPKRLEHGPVTAAGTVGHRLRPSAGGSLRAVAERPEHRPRRPGSAAEVGRGAADRHMAEYVADHPW